jgi:hypothetical protein
MTIFGRYAFIAFLALLTSIFTETTAYADSVTVTLAGVGPVNDGVDYVLPYQLTINGQGPYNADCYDFFDNVNLGQSWQAIELTLNQAATSGAFSGASGHGVGSNALADYQEVAWLSAQATPTPQSQMDLQHTIWNVFDPGAFGVTPGMQQILGNLATAQASSYNGFSFANFLFLEATTGNPGDGTFPQAFVIDTNGNTTGSNPIAPEPDSVVLLGIGVALIAVSRRFWTRLTLPKS